MNLRRVLKSLTLRLTLVYMALFTGSVGLMLAVTYVAGVWRPLRAVEATIRADGDRLAAIYAADGRDALIRALEARVAAAKGRLPYHVLIAPGGAVVAANLQDWPDIRSGDWVRYEFGTYATGTEEEHEAVVRDMALRDGYRLLVGVDTEDLDEREDMIFEALSWGAGMSLLLGLLGGLVMTYAVSHRLERINRAARAVIGGDLSGRVELHGSGDDFDQLSATLNEMLARIEGLVASISRVSDNIAHELRTPLTRLRAELEELAAAGDPEEARTLAAAALDEAQRLQAMFEALLRIARLQSGPSDAHAPVDLTLLLEDAVDLHRPAAEEKGQALDLRAPAGLAIRGDRDLVFQVLSNLLDNAVKFTPPGGAIRVEGRREGHAVELAVSDNGPGVPADERPRVLERFYRSGKGDAPGFGLGLSLVAAAAERHGADLRLEDAAPGLRVVVRFPT
ncbi:MAG: HAMP domain-containing histidine kinase [Phenylobacterium sp.]|uniref:sensor histidine kinase n=1 Tax=Phenylobacterium sp. TaxID=1871053 RepID=UPI001A5870A8|nr:HAMP domain-containing sensor histidine kinase [Phenylobacterium sp.]MBL8553057.1 HAMP domain-containing histidine kinase [Phenylobacterium sp.]